MNMIKNNLVKIFGLLACFICMAQIDCAMANDGDPVVPVNYYDPIDKTMKTYSARHKALSGDWYPDSDCNIYYFDKAYNSSGKTLEIPVGRKIIFILKNAARLDLYRVKVSSNAELVIYGESENCSGEISCSVDEDDHAGFTVHQGSIIRFNGGHIISKSDESGAAIGTYEEEGDDGYLIEINHGKVEAYCSTKNGDGAAIGSGQDRAMGGTIRITGGTVIAECGEGGGAGIGGGFRDNIGQQYYRKSGSIIITGGDITAKGGDWGGAGIGSGCDGTCNLDIQISGGTITARGGGEAAGIGCGNSGDDVNITISGGVIYAYGGIWGAGIGRGDDCENSGQKIKITGGYIHAVGGEHAAGIGGGEHSTSDIEISGGIVLAEGGSDTPHDIGDGMHDIDSGPGSFTTGENGGAIIKARAGRIKGADTAWRGVFFRGEPFSSDLNVGEIKIGGGEGSKTFTLNINTPLYLNPNDQIRVPQNVTLRIPKGVDFKACPNNLLLDLSEGGNIEVRNQTAAEAYLCNVRRRVTIDQDLRYLVLNSDNPFTFDANKTFMQIYLRVDDPNSTRMPVNVQVLVNNIPLAENNDLLNYQSMDGSAFPASTDVSKLSGYCYDRQTGIISIGAYSVVGTIKIIANGKKVSGVSPDGYVIVTPTMDSLDNDYFIVTNDVTRTGSVKVNGRVELYTCAGTTYDIAGGLLIEPKTDFAIMSHNGAAGAIKTKGKPYEPGIELPETAKLKINDGTITAVGGTYAAGIGTRSTKPMGDLEINGGTITATGGVNAAGIGGGNQANCGKVTITDISNRTEIVAIGGKNAAGIGGGYTGGATGTAGSYGELHFYGGNISARSTSLSVPGIGSSQKDRTTFRFITHNEATGEPGHAVIRTNYVVVQTPEDEWSAIIFESENGSGYVYGDQTLHENLTIAESETLKVPKGTTLTIPDGMELNGTGKIDLSDWGVINNNGTIADSLRFIYPSLKDVFETSERAVLSEATIDQLNTHLNGRTPDMIRVKDSATGAISVIPYKTLNEASEKYGRYFTDYYYVDTSSSSQWEVQVKEPKFSVYDFDVQKSGNETTIGFKVRVENAKFAEGVRVKVISRKDLKFTADDSLKEGIYEAEIADSILPTGNGERASFQFTTTNDLQTAQKTDPDKQFFKVILLPKKFE